MPQTPLGLVYPDSAGHTRLWEHLQALAESIDAAVPFVQSGTVSLDANNVSQVSDTATFPEPFAAVPVVVASSDNSWWNAQARNVTAAGFSAAVRTVTNTARTEAIVLSWVAVGVRA